MQAGGRAGRDARLRAAAALVICLLGLTLATSVHAAQGQRHATRGIAMVATAAADAHPLTSRGEPGTLGTAPVSTAAVIGRPTTADSSRSASRPTAHTPPVRGPPAQALA
jgi:hypothetical protein